MQLCMPTDCMFLYGSIANIGQDHASCNTVDSVIEAITQGARRNQWIIKVLVILGDMIAKILQSFGSFMEELKEYIRPLIAVTKKDVAESETQFAVLVQPTELQPPGT